jgi:tyrosyl-tRNA synthetase
MTEERVRANVESQKRIFERLLDFSGPHAATMTNNLDWLARLGFIEALRDLGKHFSVNEMIKRDSVRERLEAREQGISYTEFSYMLLQAYDFLHLYRESNVTVQIAGSDQWGNIVAGIDLIRRHHQSHDREGAPPRQDPTRDHAAFGLTAPLVTKADGTKFGKTESGAVWLSPDRTSPYAFYQFWLNASDADAGKWIRFFTFLPHEEVESLERSHSADPGGREAHRALARHMTALVHGEAAMRDAAAAAGSLFSGDVAGLPLATLSEVFASVPSSEHRRDDLAAAADGRQGFPLVDLLPLTTLCKSKREAREHLQAGAITVNGRAVGVEDRLTPDMLLHGSIAAIRRGKRSWHVTRWR